MYTIERVANIDTADALVKFSADIATNLDDANTVAVQALLLEFSKAFDRMRPDLAIEKLLSLNVNPTLVRAVHSFFDNRKQRVKYQKRLSVYDCCRIGVPQGTIMGPILWNIFVNDLQPQLKHMKYADDTTIYNTIQKTDVTISESTARKATISFIENPLQCAATYAANWCDTNEMLLNTTKSNVITFSVQKKITSTPICIENTTITENEDVKLLGVHFDQHLKFSKHVDKLIERTRPSVHAITKLRKAGVSSSSLALFYKARVLSILSYSAPSWFPFLSQHDNKEKLENHQKLCLRAIKPTTNDYNELLSSLNLSELNLYLSLHCLRYVEKVKKSPSHILHSYIPIPTTGRNHRKLARPKYRTELLGKSLFYKFF